MRDFELLRLLGGGRRPLLAVRVEPGMDEPVARLHLAVNEPPDGWAMRKILLVVDGVRRAIPSASVADQWEPDALPDELGVAIRSEAMRASMATFARADDFLAVAMTSHSLEALAAAGIEAITYQQAVDALDDVGRKHLARNLAAFVKAGYQQTEIVLHNALVRAAGVGSGATHMVVDL